MRGIGALRAVRHGVRRAANGGRVALRRHNRRFLAQFVADGALVFDVGAHIGAYTRLALDLGARVVAVEPNPVLAERLRRRFPGERLTVEEVALGATPGTATLHVGENDSLSTTSPEWAAQWPDLWTRTVEVRVTTLDALIDRYGVPDFLKVDTEGNDYEALTRLGRAPRAVSFEFHGSLPDETRACVQHLAALGPYRFNLTVREIARWRKIELELVDWVEARGVVRRIEELSAGDPHVWGNVYARRS